jgi:hypothetical protein
LRRWLFNLAAATSLVLLAAVVVLWVRSHRSLETVYLDNGALFIASGEGQLAIYVDENWRRASTGGWSYADFGTPAPAELMLTTRTDPPDAPGVLGGSACGITFLVRRVPDVGLFRVLGIAPHWAVLLLASIVPLARVVSWQRSRRHRRGDPSRCARCGYDLRATPERCPECGTVPAGSEQGRGGVRRWWTREGRSRDM